MRIALFLFGAALLMRAQTFEVVSIKLSNPDRRSEGTVSQSRFLPGRWIADGTSAGALIGLAYQIRESEISGGPVWIKSEQFDIDAKLPAKDARPEEFRAMLQAMLADLFQLSVHREVQQLAVYELNIAKSGAKLKETPDGIPPMAAGIRATRYTGQGISMVDFARMLPNYVDRRVIDKTGLSGKYYFRLEWNIRSSPEDPPAPSIFTAIQEQLGLKLESAKGPVETIIIDRIEKPSAN